jgi:hypothetical protein
MSLSLNVVKEKEKEEDIERKGQNEKQNILKNRLFSNPSVSFTTALVCFELWKLTEI